MNRRLAVALAAPLLTLSLAACGGDPESADTAEGADSASSAPSSSAPATTPTAEATPTEPTETASETEAPSSQAAAADGADPGPAAEGAVLVAGTEDNPPTAVGAWAREGDDPEYLAYTMGEFTNSYSLVADAEIQAMSEEVVQMTTPAGTGVCGKTEGGFSSLCYLASADGVILVLGDDDLPIPDLVVFANQLTAALGTA